MGQRLSVAEKRRRAEGRYPGILSLLGQITDLEVAVRYNFSGAFSIQGMRKRLEIPAFGSPEIRRLRLFRDVSVLCALCQKKPGIYKKLGIWPDTEIAAYYGLELLAVSAIRNLLGILAYNAERVEKPERKKGPPALSPEEYRDKIAEDFPNIFSMFGKIYDTQIAKFFRVTASRIGQIRNRLGIPALPMGRKLPLRVVFSS
jgi:hypothetical protein